ncbi:MAG: right-handed parallel beta-helix repeat-containing protein, partial [Thermoflexales bacterium]|nr:right-handed parallel beta-helix repeat-containing protein [Thermoflexales bacterium]
VRSAGDFLYRHRTLDSASLGGLRFEVDDILVTAGNALTVTAGTEVRFDDEIIVQNNAGLFALGTATQPVTFTSSISPGVPGQVQYIAFGTGSRGVLRHCDVSSAGNGNNGALIIASSAVTVEHCRIHHNAGDAVRVWDSSQPKFTCNQVFSNTFGMRNFTPATPVTARYNWWGHSSGPQHSSNPSGQGNAVSDGVQFVPFLTAPGGGICQLGMGPRAFVPTARQ